MGDDFDRTWAPVQQSVNNFVLSKGFSSFESPASYLRTWSVSRGWFRAVKLVGVGMSPLLTKLPAQWLLRKPRDEPNGPTTHPPVRQRWKPTSLPCCLNGWLDPPPLNWSGSPRICPAPLDATCAAAASTPRFFTRCRQPKPSLLSQRSCKLSDRLDGESAVKCKLTYACSSPGYEWRTQGRKRSSARTAQEERKRGVS